MKQLFIFLLSLLCIDSFAQVSAGTSTNVDLHARGNATIDGTLSLPNQVRKLLDTTTYKPIVRNSSGQYFYTDWAAFSGGSAPPFSDAGPFIHYSGDATKQFRFNAFFISPGADRTVNIQDFDHTIAALDHDQTYTGTHDFTGGAALVPNRTANDNSDNAANTAYVDAAVAAAGAAPISGVHGLIFSQTGIGTTLANSTTKTNIMGAGVGSTSIVGGTYYLGEVISLHGLISISSAASGSNSLTLSILGNNFSVSLAASTTQTYEVMATGTITTTGSSGVINWMFKMGDYTGGTTQYLGPTGSSAINTTISNDFSVNAQWITASSSNSLSTFYPFTIKIE